MSPLFVLTLVVSLAMLALVCLALYRLSTNHRGVTSVCPHGAWSPASCPNCCSNSRESRESRSTLRRATTPLVHLALFTGVFTAGVLWPDLTLFVIVVAYVIAVTIVLGLTLYRLTRG